MIRCRKTLSIFSAIIILTLLKAEVQGSHIIFLHHLSSYSHRVATSPLAERLISHGHEVTYISSVQLKRPVPNITDVIPKRLVTYLDRAFGEFDIQYRLQGLTPPMHTFEKTSVEACEALLISEEFKAWMDTKPKVDLIIVDAIPECGFGLAHKLQTKIAIFLPFLVIQKFIDAFAIPDESAAIPLANFLYQTAPLSFWDRFQNVFIVIGYYFNSLWQSCRMEEIIRRELDLPDLPHLQDMYENVSLVLMNGHFLDEHPRSLPPMFVSVPGIHIKETKEPLPDDTEAFIANPTDKNGVNKGFIYISLGTVVNPENMPKQILEMFFEAIEAFPQYKFLWKWSGAFPEGTNIPKNLYFSKWFSQQDVLAHSKIRGFITQGGRPSTQEALYHGVPLIVFPILGDQDYNANRVAELGVAIRLEIGETTSLQLGDSIAKITNSEYKLRSLKYSKLFKDLPMKPIDTAVWWTEYVLRNDDLSHLKPPGRILTWYQRRQLDVWATVTVILLTLTYALKRLVAATLNRKQIKTKQS